MNTVFKEFHSQALFRIESQEYLKSFTTAKPIGMYSFIWATEASAQLVIDSQPITLQPNQILALTPIQFLEYQSGSQIRVYQFNREFYCIKDHDQTVGCAGALFFGNNFIPIITLDTVHQEKYSALHHVFLDELDQKDQVQAEMLRMLMSRFIITSTRLLQQIDKNHLLPKSKTDLIRQFNVLVEEHFKQEHSVSFYANLLNKSPKTLSNSFAKFKRSPLQIIHDRIVLETKRLLNYSDKTTKEIAYQIGFDDASHLSKLFKKHTGMSPTQFKRQQQIPV